MDKIIKILTEIESSSSGVYRNFMSTDEIKICNKLGDLRAAIGQEFSDNYSSTFRSVLVNVSADGNTCTIKEAPSSYKSGNQKPKLGLKTQPSWLTWNAMFF